MKREFPFAKHWLLSDRPDGGKSNYDPEIVAAAKNLGVAGLALDYRGVDKAFRTRLTLEKQPLYVWTVNDPAMAKVVEAWGADWVETDNTAVVCQKKP